MKRRDFIKQSVVGALALAALDKNGKAFGNESRPSRYSATPDGLPQAKPFVLRGVNLGGWLVLEKWMVPSVYRGCEASDEYGLSLALGSKAESRLNQHREKFITAEDFKWIKNRGLNAIRLPVGYWTLEGPKPYVTAEDFLDFAFEQASQNGLKVLLDLHGAPGSQNGWDHSGRSGGIGWDKNPDNIRETVRVLAGFAQKFGSHPALFGIELLNEPSTQIPIQTLKEFYIEAYSQIRKHAGEQVAVVFHDSFRAMDWKNFMKAPDFSNVIMDTHLYQLFTKDDARRTAQEQIAFALNRKFTLEEMQAEELPTLVGEWSLGLPESSAKNLSLFQGDLLHGAFADAQLLSFENSRGWFFWSYKTESDSEWNFRHCVQRGWLPEQFPA